MTRALRSALFVALFFLPALAAAPLPGGPRPARAQTGRASDGFAAYRAALEAQRAGDYETYRSRLLLADSLLPGQPALPRRLAGACARLGRLDEADGWLRRFAAMSVQANLDGDKDLEPLRDRPAYARAKARIDSLAVPVTGSQPAFELAERGLITEGIAWDDVSGRFFVSSVRKRKILAVDRDRKAHEFAPAPGDSLFSPLGIRVDGDRRCLWAVTSALPEMAGYRPDQEGGAELCRLDLDSGRVLERWSIPDTGRDHNLNDLAVDGRGNLYLSDSRSGALYRAEPGDLDAAGAPAGGARAELSVFLPRGSFGNPGGLALSPDDRILYVADYGLGLFTVDPATREIGMIEAPDTLCLVGIDGLVMLPDGLVVIQNGIAPHRLVRLWLDPSGRKVVRWITLDRENPAFDEPTLGLLLGQEIFYIARSQWSRILPGGGIPPEEELEPHLVMRVRVL